MTRKACCFLVGTAAMGLLALLGWLLYPASPGAQAEAPALVAAAQSADVRIVNQWVEGPAQIPLSQNVPINVKKVLHNLGPYGPVNVRTVKTATPPPGCTIAPPIHEQEIFNLQVSVDVTINEPFTIRCDEPSWHTFTFDNVISITTAGVQDPNTSNNTWHSEWTVASVTSADLKVVSQKRIVWPSSPISASVNVPVTLETEVQNSGPYQPVIADVQGQLAPPTGCTVQPNPAVTQVTLNAGETKKVQQQFTIHCLTGGLKTFSFYSRIDAKDPHIGDPDLTNNERFVFLPSFTVLDTADVKITSQGFVSPPTQINVNEYVDVTLRKHIHNNGPANPVDITISTTASAPADCSVTPKNVPSSLTAVPLSVDQVVDEVWTIRCTQPSSHSFTFNNAIAPVYLQDLDLTNNQRSSVLQVTAIAQANVGISSQALVSPPSEIGVSENVNVTLRKHLHNNGPYQSVQVSISASASAPSDCTATPATNNPTTATLPMSTDVVVDEVWSIHCNKASSHSFSFSDAIAVTTPHVVDLNQGNNSTSTPLTVTAVGKADVKITSQQLVSPPSEIELNKDVSITLRKHLHNNGPYQSVQVSISPSASAPADCTATPATGNPTSATLPASTDTVLDEVWTIKCTKASSHEFSFNDAIAITTLHVVDLNQGNNSTSTPLTVTAVGKADVKISSQELVDPPTEIELNKDVSITVRKHLHNNGPYGPVGVSVSPSVVEPLGCTATLEEDFGGESFSIAASSEGEAFQASSDGIVVGFDMDPSGNSCPNSASGPDCTLGTIEPCVEVSAGAIFEFDIFMDGTPLNEDILGFGYYINAFPGKITARLHNSGTVNLPAQPGSSMIDISDSVPDSSPPFAANVADLGTAELNPPFTKGVLGRYKLDLAGVVPNVYGMTLSTVLLGNYGSNDLCTLYGCTVWDANFDTQYGLIAVDTDCPEGPPPPSPTPQTYTLTMAVSPSGAGTTIPPEGIHTYDEGTPVNLTAMPNSGYTFDSWSGDADCEDGSVTMDTNKSCIANFLLTPTPSPTPPPTPPPGVVELPVSVDTEVEETWTIRCTEPSAHTFSFGNEIAISDVHVTDPVPGNNSTSTDLTVDAIGKADVRVVSVQVNGPTEIDTSEDVNITVSTTLRNNGPWGPVEVGLSYAPSAPPDCSVETVDPPQVSLPANVNVVDNHTWTIHCSQPSTHTFSFRTDITGIKDPHVVDPDGANNTGSTDYTVEAWAYADLKLADQYIQNPPSEIPVSQNVKVTLKKVIHNNGDYEPVDAVTETTVVVPSDCTVRPTTHVQEFYNIPVSADVIHEEPFTIHCSDVSSHKFVFNGEIAMIGNAHVRDPDLDNDKTSTDLVVAAVAPSDVRIKSVGFVNPPTKVPLNQWVDITLRKIIHNSGPWQPVNISINATATVSGQSGCVIVPKNVPSSLSNVPVSVDQTVDEVWSVRCTQTGLKTFFFDNLIDVTNAHVYDPDTANNKSHKLLTVRDDTYPYWGTEICDDKDNDGDTVVDEGWDLNDNTIADCLDPDLNSDCDGLNNKLDEDDDGDGWTDEDEGFMRTDPLNACPVDADHDAWPPDIQNGASGCGYHDGEVKILDVLCYKPYIKGPYDRRYDFNTDGATNILDVLRYKGLIGTSCSSC